MFNKILTFVFKILFILKGYLWTYYHCSFDADLMRQIKNIDSSSLSLEQNVTTQLMEPMHFYIEDLLTDPIVVKQAQDLIFDAIPIKLSFRDDENNSFSDYDNYLATNQHINEDGGFTRRYWNFFLNYNRLNDDFAVFAGNLLNEYPIYLLEFSGQYTAGTTHSDASPGSLFGCYNFYYLKKGGKKATILPPIASKYINLEYFPHSIVAKGENIWDESFLNDIPYYYQFEIHENEFVLFNNCDSIHKFENIDIDKYGYYPIGYSLRLSNRKRKLYHVAKTNYQLILKSNQLSHITVEQLIASNSVFENNAFWN